MIGREVKRLREAAGLTQDRLAIAAQAFGLDWGQAIISAIEVGRRDLSFGEINLLPHLLIAAGATAGPLHFLDLLPDTDEQVRLAGHAQASLKAVRNQGARLQARVALTMTARGDLWTGISEADRKAARALHTSPTTISEAARALWGRELAEERDRRIADPGASAQKRGRITRMLLRELKPRLARRRRK